MVTDNDSIYIERRTETGSYKRIVALKRDTGLYIDEVPYSKINYYYRIIAHYDSAEDMYSYPQRIYMPVYVPKVREPFLGSPLSIPGTIEAEDFDKGGEGLTYHDADVANIAGAYRPDEGVDIYDRNGKGYHIGNALPGEWYEYTVNVAEEDEYRIDILLAAFEGGATFKLKIGDIESDTLTVPTTYSWLLTDTVTTVMSLKAGEQIMRFTVIDGPMFNIDKIEFSLKSASVENLLHARPSWSIYQNQSHELVFNSADDNPAGWLKIYNITGSLILSVDHPQNHCSISATGITAGIYFIQVLANNRTDTRKIIINAIR
jgi:hypothetical protein